MKKGGWHRGGCTGSITRRFPATSAGTPDPVRPLPAGRSGGCRGPVTGPASPGRPDHRQAGPVWAQVAWPTAALGRERVNH